ncbi:high-affinity Zn(2+) transporter zrt1 [Rhizophlyctis rosea]|uniref:High-affinity Zn(2+) transporter zrt1 n=1 Tax=Rhizophlyctis rosea TaxID=64517 RepID=A0AAD5SIH3_9FUNG|nr:high-affinity Zn(2+) transporter zrt1 [Rhizophlyctis rosea]
MPSKIQRIAGVAILLSICLSTYAQAAEQQNEVPIDPCASIMEGPYNTALHVLAIFVIMITSLLGTLIPLWGSWMGGDKITPHLPLLKLFSTGVILSTALIHMYSPASSQLAEECLPSWIRAYEALPSALVLLGMLITWTGQVVAGRVYGSGHGGEDGEDEGLIKQGEFDDWGQEGMGMQELRDDVTVVFDEEVIIGIALGTAREEFVTLLAAVSVHQFFEGVAVGSLVLEDEKAKAEQAGRNGEHKFGGKGVGQDWRWWMKVVWLGVGYSITTPVGIIIGIALNTAVTTTATPTLILQSVLDAIGAGVLLYDGLVNVLVPHFASPERGGPAFGLQVACVWVGAIVMGIVGIWA